MFFLPVSFPNDLKTTCPQLRSDCDVNITCRLERFPKHWLAEPPPRFLPKLADIEAEEASSRLHYWGAILLFLSRIPLFQLKTPRPNTSTTSSVCSLKTPRPEIRGEDITVRRVH